MSLPKKLLVVTVSVIVTTSIITGGLLLNHKHTSKPAPTSPQTSSTASAPPQKVDKDEVFALVNQQRVQNGLPALVHDPRLDSSALAKCNDMVAKNYWAHDAPDGTPPWQFMTDQGINFRLAAENLAYGQHTAYEVVNDWINSPGHRANIFNPNYTNVGYAVCHGNNYNHSGSVDITVEHFATLR